MIGVVDYQMGNLGSIINMLKRIGVQAGIVGSADGVRQATRLILPGVGAFDAGMENLEGSGLRPALDEAALDRRIPILGICLGMQLFTRGSEEGQRPGLGWVRGETVRWRLDPKATGLRVPHMGWNSVKPKPDSVLFAGFAEPPRFYFVHSYHVICDDLADVDATVTYGYEAVAAVAHGNVFGVQFHPEKSHRFGMRVLENFARTQATRMTDQS